MNKTICIYHANCFDGMAAAWVVKRKYPEAELIAANYGQDFPFNMYGKNDDIIIVDFSYPRDIMLAIERECKSILVLDHHKTAQANCEGLSFCKFDMEQSGAGLAWRYFFPDIITPRLIQYIEDRDLWHFYLMASKDVNAYIQSYPIELEWYEILYNQLETADGFHDAQISGMAIERYKDTMVAAICKHATLRQVGGYWVPLVQTGILFSEIGHYMCNQIYDYSDIQNLPGSKNHRNKPEFAASFFIRNDGVTVYSLRSIGDFDVSAIAKQYGGGGHKNAAGFQREEGQLL